MKYYYIETGDKNRVPVRINKNNAIDVRLLSREGMERMPDWTVAEMEFPEEGFFPDLLCFPCILASENCISAVLLYQPDVRYKTVKLWDRKNGANATYFILQLEEVACISEKTLYNRCGNRIERMVLDGDMIKEKAVFRIRGYDRRCIVGRMDFVESLLRRGAEGLKLEEALVYNRGRERGQ